MFFPWLYTRARTRVYICLRVNDYMHAYMFMHVYICVSMYVNISQVVCKNKDIGIPIASSPSS